MNKVVLYVVVALFVVGVIYYFVAGKKPTNTPEAPLAANTVEISNFTYSPVTITVKVGDTVTWANKDSMSHSATADDNSFDTGLFGNGKTGTVTFSKAGTFPYHCSLHPNMHGTVIVQ